MTDEIDVALTVNDKPCRVSVPARLLLSDLLRHRLGLTGTHVGCEQGVCGACTVLLDGRPVRSCLLFAVQADGGEVRTIEGVASEDGTLSPVQQAFSDHHAMQCGFCTSGFIMSTEALLRDVPEPSDDQIVETLGGHVCRCTGYQNILAAVQGAAEKGAEA